MMKSHRLVGGDLWNVLTTPQECRARADRVLHPVAAGTLRVTIAGSFPLRAGAEAHRLLESRRTIGKVLLIPG